jgi:Na+/H+-translocating membrane pyrophosphatase
VGDCAARGADLFESIAAEIISAMILGGTMAQKCKIDGKFRDFCTSSVLAIFNWCFLVTWFRTTCFWTKKIFTDAMLTFYFLLCLIQVTLHPRARVGSNYLLPTLFMKL